MEDLSLHILDLVENSIEAGASKVEVRLREDLKADRLTIEIDDNGKGMDDEMLKRALDPFFTTKKVRRVGLGLSLFQQAALAAGGDFAIQSKPGRGTKLKASFQLSHIDRKPLGDMTKTVITLIVGHPDVRLMYQHRKNGLMQRFDSGALTEGQDLSSMSVVELVTLVRKHLQVKNKPDSI